MSKVFTVSIPVPLFDKLQAFCDLSKRTRSGVVANAVEEYINSVSQAVDVEETPMPEKPCSDGSIAI